MSNCAAIQEFTYTYLPTEVASLKWPGKQQFKYQSTSSEQTW